MNSPSPDTRPVSVRLSCGHERTIGFGEIGPELAVWCPTCDDYRRGVVVSPIPAPDANDQSASPTS